MMSSTTEDQQVVEQLVNRLLSVIEEQEKSPPPFPYLHRAGLDIENVGDVMKNLDWSSITRISEDELFTNGIIQDIRKLLRPYKLTNERFFQFVKCVVSPSTEEMLSKTNAKNFSSHMRMFDKKLKNAQKNKRTDTFLDLVFVFQGTKSTVVDSPNKRKLKQSVHSLQNSKKLLIEKNVNLQRDIQTVETKTINLEEKVGQYMELELEQSEVIVELQDQEMQLVNELERQDREIRVQKEKLEMLMNERSRMNQKVKGLKSGLKRKESAVVASSSSLRKTNMVDKRIDTEIYGINTDLINVIDKSQGVFTGVKYFGTDSNFKRLTDGKLRKYIEIPDSKERSSTVNKKELQRRVHLIEDVVKHVAQGVDTKVLYAELVKLNKDDFKDGLDNAGINVTGTLSTKDAVAIQSLLRLPTNKMRNLRICLNNLRMNVFPSERKMRNEKNPVMSHINEQSIETGFIGLRRTKNDTNISACPYLKVKCLVSFLEEIIYKDSYGFQHDGDFNDKWWFLFSGDKGEHHMKYFVEIVNSRNSGSVDNVHIYAIFEAQDSTENMLKVWFTSYREQLIKMQSSDFQMKDGRGINVFLGGDYHFLDDNLGHQGSSATYPSACDKVLRSHLQNHPTSPHTPDICKVEVRTIRDYHENYNENLADNRNHSEMNENGKFHCSVVGPMIFPLVSLDQVVPPSLHIMLGVVLLLYNLLLKECQKVDQEEGNLQRQVEEKNAINQEWEIASQELHKASE